MNIIRQHIKIHVKNHVRAIHTSVLQNSQAKMMKKVMGGLPKKKFKYHEKPILPTPNAFSKGAFEGKRSSNSKRANVLNKVFMRYITDLMATGESSSEFVGHGIEINKVQIAPDFNCVNVFWIAKGTEKDDDIAEILNKNTGSLRHELAQLKVVGVIPKIKFVKDKEYARNVEIDRLLSQADFGDDYVPVDLSLKLKTELELNTSLEPHVLKRIQEVDSEKDEVLYEEPIPPMPNNVFGLNHSEIMDHVKRSTKKSQALHRLQSEDNVQIPHSVNANPLQFNSTQEEREAFQQFLKKRQILKTKAVKLDKNYSPELDYFEEEWQNRQKKEFSTSYDDNLIDDKDFIYEEVENEK